MEYMTGAHLNDARHSIDLCGVWRFQPDPNQTGEQLGYHLADCDTRRWREVRVPIAFDDCLPELTGYEGAGWFRCILDLPEECAAQHLSLRFEGVHDNARVWVNGQFAGAHNGGFLRFSLPVTHLLRPGLNSIAVRADNMPRDAEAPPKQPRLQPAGGILRDVALDCQGLIRLEQPVFVAEATGVFEAHVRVVNDTDQDCEAGVVLVISDASGNPVFSSDAHPVLVAGRTAQTVSVIGLAPNITPWSPEQPALYTAAFALAHSAGFDEIKTRIGFRTVEIVGGRFILNGRPIRLHGFNRHEDAPRRGMTPDPEQVEQDLRQMKQLGANFVRLCHHPHHPLELDVCDQIGMLVMGEISLDRDDGDHLAERQVREMIERDVNHPSIILWSISDEIDGNSPEAIAGNLIAGEAELVDLARRLDRSRPVTHVSDRRMPLSAFTNDDVICVNGYPSWSDRGRRAPPNDDFADAVRWWRDHLDALHTRYPDKPILISAFGYPALRGVFGNDLGEDAQARAICEEARAFDLPYVCGMTLWCYADHPAPEESLTNRMTTSPFGVVTRDRRPKQALHHVATLFGGTVANPVASPPDNAPVTMIRSDLNDIPEAPFPEGYSIRPLRVHEGGLWEDIQRDAEPFFTVQPGLFAREFGDDPGAIERRCYVIVGPNGCAVGTISAWYDRHFKGQDWGRVHWVAVRRAHQGKGLAKAGLSFTLKQLARWHERAMLDTSTGRIGAIKLYLDFGFVPDLDQPRAREAWLALKQRLSHPALRDVR
ncbi:MAG: GNAT family N-acetyltransferase [Anaerolineae bacterium]|nr:GNAT family N-acetyltransferase [Thermoflexales bacterium]MDW8407285.1 GNAT family N-acetyltransferase [Anaerolineae bacterium]